MSNPSNSVRRRLSGREIRLLYLCPSADPEQQLECYCTTFNLEEAPPYEALSYVWGTNEPSTRKSILFDGQIISIGRGLAEALIRLRLSDSTRILWADALCIDQNDNEEKSHQVPLMGSIYSRAERTVVWLGDADSQHARDAAECVKRITAACKEYTLEHGISQRGLLLHLEKIHLPLEMFTPAICTSLRLLYDRPWFSRIWCIQEAKLAKHVTMLWGVLEIPWLEIGTAASWILRRQGAVLDSKDPLYSRLQDITALKAAIINELNTSSWTLSRALYFFYNNWEASDPRDKVYGLLGLIAPNESQALTIDYKKAVIEVLADTALSLIRVHSDLSALEYISHSEEYQADACIPSWVPHWDKTSKDTYRFLLRSHNACAGRPIKMMDKENSGPMHLSLTGITYDTVCTLLATMYYDALCSNILEDTGQPDTKHPIFQALNATIPGLNQLSLEECAKQWRKVARTLIGGIGDYSDLEKGDNLNSEAIFYESSAHLIHIILRGSDPDTDDLAIYQNAPLAFLKDIRSACDYRRIFFTQNGSYGLGPACMRPGDIVVVLYGGQYPYVLRPHGDNYLLMGPAYVDDLMDGHLIHELEAGKREEQHFRIV